MVEQETGRTSRHAFHESVHSLPVQAREMLENTTAFRSVNNETPLTASSLGLRCSLSVLLLLCARHLLEMAVDASRIGYHYARKYAPIILAAARTGAATAASLATRVRAR